MAEVREMTEKEASDFDETAPDVKFLGKTHYEDYHSLWYEKGGLYYQIWVTPDSSCWSFGGVVYDSIDDLPEGYQKG